MFGVMTAARANPSKSETGSNTAAAVIEANRRFYDGLWSDARLIEPERFNTWPLVSELIARSKRRLEIAPGLRPRLPILGTHFVDISWPAVAKLHARGASATLARSVRCRWPTRRLTWFALDIVEHVEDDAAAWSELTRVAAPGATVLIATPLHPEKWMAFDDIVGHYRRYEPAELMGKLEEHNLVVEQIAVYGMQLKSSLLLDLGMWWLANRRRQAMRWYNRVWFPLALRI